MKALTVRQPWAYLIVRGDKDIENRKWRPVYRGLLAIHAGGSREAEPLPRGVPPPEADDLVYSAIVSVVTLDDIVEKARSKWFSGPYGWKLVDPVPLSKPVDCRGRLSLWTVPEDVEQLVRRRLPASVRERIRG